MLFDEIFPPEGMSSTRPRICDVVGFDSMTAAMMVTAAPSIRRDCNWIATGLQPRLQLLCPLPISGRLG